METNNINNQLQIDSLAYYLNSKRYAIKDSDRPISCAGYLHKGAFTEVFDIVERENKQIVTILINPYLWNKTWRNDSLFHGEKPDSLWGAQVMESFAIDEDIVFLFTSINFEDYTQNLNSVKLIKIL